MKRYITINPHGNKERIFNVNFIEENIKDQLVYLFYEDERYYGVITSVDEDSISIMSGPARIIIQLSVINSIHSISMIKEEFDKFSLDKDAKFHMTKYSHDDLTIIKYNKVIEINTDIISADRFLLVKVKSSNNNNIRLLKITNTHIDGCKAIIRYGYETQNAMECRYILPSTMACQFDTIPYEKLTNDYELITSFDNYDEFEEFFKSKLGIE